MLRYSKLQKDIKILPYVGSTRAALKY